MDGICQTAEEVGADFVLVGNRGLGNVGTLVLGSVSEKAVRKSRCTVIVVKGATSDSSDWEKVGNALGASQHFAR